MHVEYLEELSESHQSVAGLLMLLWTCGTIDLINLEQRECVQIFENSDDQERPTSVAFFPQVRLQLGNRSRPTLARSSIPIALCATWIAGITPAALCERGAVTVAAGGLFNAPRVQLLHHSR